MTRRQPETGSERAAGGTTGRIVAVLAGVFVLGVAAQHLAGLVGADAGKLRILAVAAGVAAFAGTLAAATSKRLLPVVASASFGAVSLVTLTLLSILGTVILQGQGREVMLETYGSLNAAIDLLFLGDLFHGFGFSALIGTTAGALVATVARTKRLTLRRLGLIGAHLGCIVVLAGAAVGSIWGIKGRIKMHVDEEQDSFVVQRSDGTTARIPLGFTVRLDAFELLRYEPDYRLSIFEVEKDGEKLVASIDPRSGKAAEKLREHGATLVGYWPDHQMKLEVEPAAAGGRTVAALGLGTRSNGNGRMWILDDGTPGGGRLEGAGIGPLAFVWDAGRAERLLGSAEEGAGPVHVIAIGSERIAVEVGKVYPLPGASGFFRVVSAFGDFVIDPETKQPSERSASPNNPAVHVEIQDGEGSSIGTRWLFANFPSFNHGDGAPGPDMRYGLEGAAVMTSGTLAVGETRQVWTIREGKIAGTRSFAVGSTIEVDGREIDVEALHHEAVASYRHSSRSDEARNPMAEVQVDGESLLVSPGRAVDLGGGLVLALVPRGDDVRDYVSTLTVMGESGPVLTRKVEVNSPLAFGGYSFYQSEYDPRDPSFSGFEVVKDPGIALVYGGLGLLLASVMHVILVVPLVRRIRPMAAGAGPKGGS